MEEADKQSSPKGVGVPRWLSSGRSFPLLLALSSLGVTAVVVAVAYGWAVHLDKTLAFEARTQQVRTVTQSLAQVAESALLSDNLSLLQKSVADSQARHSLQQCTVTLPNGQIVADLDPDQVQAQSLPAQWQTQADKPPSESVDASLIRIRHPLTVPGRGSAVLEVAATLDHAVADRVSPHTVLATTGACALGLLSLLYGYVWRRLRAMGAIRGALMAYKGSDTPAELLGVSAAFGPETAAWSGLLEEIKEVRGKQLIDQANEVPGQSQRGGGRLDEACDTMSQGLILIEESLHIRYANGAAAIFAGTQRENMLGQPVAELIKDEQVLEAVKAAADEIARKRSVIELNSGDGPGSSVLRYNIRPVRREDPGSVIIIIEDITQQRVAEQSRNDFVSQVAHELRNPLSNIRLYVEAMLEDDTDVEMRSRSVNVINLETKRLERLVNDMLSVAEIEAGSMDLRCDDLILDTLMEEVRADYEPQAKEKGVSLSLILPPKVPTIQGDRDKVLMAVHNVVGNAVKYTPSGGSVEISVEEQQERLVIEVRDTGLGISDSDKPHVFEKFYRAQDDRLVGIPGTGLGLPLAREVVRLHGGDITVDSQVGQGSTFILSLPIRPQAA